MTEQSSESLFQQYGGTPVVAFANEKGGVAKTTSCVNLGAVLARGGQRVLCLDLDPQANLTAALGIPEQEAASRNTYLLLKWADLPLEATILTTDLARLHLVPACPELARWEEEPAKERSKAGKLRERLRQFFVGVNASGYDTVLLDCPSSLGALTRTALTAATHLVVPVTPRLYSFRSMAGLGQLVAELHREEAATVKLLGILVTLYDPNTCLDIALYRLLRERIEQEFGDFMFSRTIAHSPLVSEAEAGGKPVAVRSPGSAAAEAYAVLAAELQERLEQDREGRLGAFAGSVAAG